MALLLGYFAILCHEQTPDHVPRIVTAVAAAVLVGLLVWVLRLVPPSARRSVFRAQPMLVVRGGLAVFAVAVGALSVAGVVPAVSLPAAIVLLLGAVVLMVVGWLTRT